MLVYNGPNGDTNIPWLSPAGIGQAAGAAPAAAGAAAIAAGSLALTGALTESVVAGITASTTHSLAGAVALTAQINQISVCAGASDAVALPLASAAQIGNTIVIINDGAAAAAVWPQAADKIDGGSAGAVGAVTNARRSMFTCISAGNWVSMGLAKST